MNSIWVTAKKELKAAFGSPMAAIFIGVFLLGSLYSFFWLETFFSRNIADIRPLFRWMPVLMIFLAAALTMRQWSEEQRMGTLEVLLTLPVKTRDLVLGKFLAVVLLVAAALVCTLGLPLTVSFLGDLDWGPVVGGYLGALLMASAYIAIGLFISSRTDNQIVALLLTVVCCGFFYLLGSANLTTFFGTTSGEFLRSLGTGSRFANIERGVVDLRDLTYYLTLAAVFLGLNVLSLESKRWSKGHETRKVRREMKTALLLVVANLLAVNVWLDASPLPRIDLTEDKRFSISETTRELLADLREPLLLRGYFSEKTHPLLAPLVPQIRDLMREYEAAGHGNVRVEFVDPRLDEEAEAEANQLYGIKPVPFQVAGRYEAAVVNSYFNILVKYGDQYVTLGFEDLIEVTPRPDGQLDVALRNLEYDLTKSIKKVVYGFEGLDTVLARLDHPVTLELISTPKTIPEQFKGLPETIRKVADELAQETGGKVKLTEIDPDQEGSPITREEVQKRYGIPALRASLFSPETFYLALFLNVSGKPERVILSPGMGEPELKREIEAAIKRGSSGFLKTVGVWTPPTTPGVASQQYRFFQQVLRENYNVRGVSLADGVVGGDVDVLVVVAPQELSDIERLAVDQYLMRGGSLVVLGGAYQLSLPPGAQTLALKKLDQGLSDLLAHYGIKVEEALVMDPVNEPFPVPVTRDIGGVVVQEIMQIDHPFFVDVRPERMNKENPITARLPAVTMNWASPLVLDDQKLAGRKAEVVLRSSPESWLSYETDIQPDFNRYPRYGFPEGDAKESRVLAVALRGAFPSFFADRDDPRLARAETPGPSEEEGEKKEQEAKEEDKAVLSPLIKESPESARLVVVGSSEFISDVVVSISQSMGQERYLNNLEFLQNIIDWAVEDESLLAIRSRGTHARLLYPISRGEQRFWEWLNYGLALAALILLFWYGYRSRYREKPILLEQQEA